MTAPGETQTKPARLPWALIASYSVVLLAIAGIAAWLFLSTPPAQEDPTAVVSEAVTDPAINAPVTAPVRGEAPPLTADTSLVETGSHGPLPRIADDGRAAWQVYARRASAAAPDRPRVSIVLGGLGMNTALTERAIMDLPPEISIAVIAYAPEAPRWLRRAREAGHEVLLAVPMEPLDYPENDPGPYPLLGDQPRGRNIANLQRHLAVDPAVIGVMPHLGARLLTDRDGLEPVLAELRDRGLLFVDSGASVVSVAPALIDSLGIAGPRATIRVDGLLTPEAIAAMLVEVEEEARRSGSAVAVANAAPLVIDSLRGWIVDALQAGFALVPVSAVSSPDAN